MQRTKWMNLSDKRAKRALLIAICMALFPPWLIRERDKPTGPFGPLHSGGYSFIAAPPNATDGYGRRTYTITTARIDIGRLLLQYVILGGCTAFISLRRKSLAEEPLDEEPPSSRKQQSLFAKHCPTFTQWSSKELVENPKRKPPKNTLDHSSKAQLRPWRYQSLHDIGYSLPSISLVFALPTATVSWWSKYGVPKVNAVSPQMVGAASAEIAVYLVSSIIGGYTVWRLTRRNRRALIIASCLAPLLLLGLTMLGNSRMKTEFTAQIQAPSSTPHNTDITHAGGRDSFLDSDTLKEMRHRFQSGDLSAHQESAYTELQRRGLIPRYETDN